MVQEFVTNRWKSVHVGESTRGGPFRSRFAVNAQSRDVFPMFGSFYGGDEFREAPLSLSNHDSVDHAAVDALFGTNRRVPASPNYRQCRMSLLEDLRQAQGRTYRRSGKHGHPDTTGSRRLFQQAFLGPAVDSGIQDLHLGSV